MSKQWVQHISGQGEKWKVEEQYGDTQWKVIRGTPKNPHSMGMSYHYLPISEYRLCEPPWTKWEPIDATYINVQVLDCDGMPVFGQFRMRCSNIEKKVQP